FAQRSAGHRALPSFPTRRSSDLGSAAAAVVAAVVTVTAVVPAVVTVEAAAPPRLGVDDAAAVVAQGGRVGAVVPDVVAAVLEHRSEEHTSELQSRENLVCRLLLE